MVGGTGKMTIKKQNKVLTKNIQKGLKIFFGDAKQSWERAMSVFSALFWTWLEFSFLKFSFIYIIGMAGYVIGDSFKYSWDMVIENTPMVNTFVIIFFVMVLIFRIKIRDGKNIK